MNSEESSRHSDVGADTEDDVFFPENGAKAGNDKKDAENKNDKEAFIADIYENTEFFVYWTFMIPATVLAAFMNSPRQDNPEDSGTGFSFPVP